MAVGGVQFFPSVRGGADFLLVGGGQRGVPIQKCRGGGKYGGSKKSVASRSVKKWPIFCGGLLQNT